MVVSYDIEKPDVNECFSKLIKAKASFGKVLLNKTNPHLKNKYADLSSVFDAIETALNTNDLFVSQNGEMLDGLFFIRTVLFDSNGHSIDFGIVPVRTTKDDAQNLGSGLTYARRYGLITALGLVGEDDDDGNLASVPQSNKEGLIIQVKNLGNECVKQGYTAEDVKKALLGVPSADLSEAQATKGIESLQALIQAKKV
jgi:hypothetical protein